MFLEPGLHAFAEQRTIGQDHGGAAFGFQDSDDEGQEEIGGFAGLEMLGKVALDAIFLAPAEGRIGEDYIHAIRLRIADVRPRQRVVVADEAGILDTVQKHVSYTEHVRKLLFSRRLAGPPAYAAHPL